ncbi:MAG: histidine kinase dimerization/phospho-acceptor domain-containing protein, partial [Lachnospiraceae bacterium]
MKLNKHLSFILHVIFLALTLTGVTFMYLNSNYGQGLTWLAGESYEDTPGFMAQLQDDIDCIFDYVDFKDVFETDGELDFDKDMVSVTYNSGKDVTYTLDELVRYAKSYGYYLNEEYKVVKSTSEEIVHRNSSPPLINWKAYKPNEVYSEPGDAYASLEDLSFEVLSYLGDYYSTRDTLVRDASNLSFIVSYSRSAEDRDVYTNVSQAETDLGGAIEALKSKGKYIYVTGSSILPDTNLSTTPDNITQLLEACNPYESSDSFIIVAIDTSYPVQDSYAIGASSFHQMRLLHVTGLLFLIIGILGCMITLGYLIQKAGHTPGTDTISLTNFDQFPTEVSLILFAVITPLFILLGDRVITKILKLVMQEVNWPYAKRLVRAVILYICISLECFSLIRRYKANTLWSNSSLKRISVYFSNVAFTLRLSICYAIFLGINLFLLGIAFFVYYNWDGPMTIGVILAFMAVLVLVDLWVFHRMFFNAWEKDQIHLAVDNIVSGNTGYQIDTSSFSGKEKLLAESINNMGIGLETALQEQVKSERLKADLITNVSHDIKTPLTSIINYVDLIKREKIPHPKLNEYLDVLEQKSQRLKNLTEDLVEASKASSGNLKLEISDIHLIQLVQQTHGEFEEKFASRHLELVSNYPSEDIIIEADGRRLWRVLENLYNNAFKYAMEHTRIYVDIFIENNNAVFTIKNVSQNPLNIKADELTERFVRGDVARTTEGSGLGLSIAKSLTQLQ